MLHQLFNIPRDQHFYIACSGGSDSMAITDFYRRGGKKFTLAYFNHSTPQADSMEAFVSAYAQQHKLPLKIGCLRLTKDRTSSPEEFLRNCRYSWFSELTGVNKDPIVTCHHLNDVAETWLFSSLHGNPKVIKPKRDNIYRPFLLNTKKSLLDWCIRHNVSWFEDQSNTDVSIPRNRIRHNILPEALLINPGLFKVLKKKITQINS